MSTRIMSDCWPLSMSPTQKVVLISLADQANDQGICWPSVESICLRTCLSERAVRKTIGDLASAGFLTINERKGRSNYYTLTPERGVAPKGSKRAQSSPASSVSTPAPDAPLHEGHPCTTCHEPLHDVHPTPAPDAGDPCTTCTQNRKEPSLNHHEPSIGSRRGHRYPDEFEQAWSDYPKRAGANPKLEAYRAWNARRKAGVSSDQLHLGVQRYARFIRITGKQNTEYVQRGSTFFGPSEHYLNDWNPPQEAGHADRSQHRPTLGVAERIAQANSADPGGSGGRTFDG